MKRFFYYSLLLISFISSTAIAQTQWQTLADGLDYTYLPIKDRVAQSRIHAFKIDLNDYNLDLAFAADHKRQATTIKRLAQNNEALLALNGGFFTPENEVIGLRIRQDEVYSPMQNTSWWGIFFIADGKPKIVAQSRYKNRKNISTAIQAGPRLIINGNIPKLKPGIADRSAVCINSAGKVILIITEQAAMSTTALAEYIQGNEVNDGLGCYNALNLDGGHSSQLYAAIGDFRLNINGFSSITDALIVLNKES